MITIEIDQQRSTGGESDYNKKLFVPFLNTSTDKMVMSLLNKTFLTIDDLREIHSIPIQFKLMGARGGEPIGKKITRYDDSGLIFWHEKEHNCWIGYKIDERGWIDYRKRATSKSRNGIYEKLIIRPMYENKSPPDFDFDELREREAAKNKQLIKERKDVD